MRSPSAPENVQGAASWEAAGDLPRRLQRLRRRLGLDQKRLAALLGVSRATVNRWEQGRSRPSDLARQQLARLEATAVSSLPFSFTNPHEHTAARSETAERLAFFGGATPLPGVDNLPAQPTPLIGRTEEIGAVCAQLVRDDVRLLTLTGPPGVGKTRLALAAAERARQEFSDGVAFVSLSALQDPDLVSSVIARQFHIQAQRGVPHLATLTDALAGRHLLLVLDNFEHLLAAAPVLAELLVACTGLKLLVTSRAPLRLRWEHTLAVLPLAAPDAGALDSLEMVTLAPAAELFVQRAQAAHPSFRVTLENARAVGEICRQLDGLPLALELAAVRSSILPPQMLLERLRQHGLALKGGPPDLPARQQSLEAAFRSSYELLDVVDRRLFRRLAVFTGDWTLEAAEVVAGEPGREPDVGKHVGGEPEVLTSLANLVNQSLFQIHEPPAGEARYRILEPLRAFALAHLRAAGELADLRARHAAHCVDQAERASLRRSGAGRSPWPATLEADEHNFRAALSWFKEQGDSAGSLRLAGALWPAWYVLGNLNEGRDWLEGALELVRKHAGEMDDAPALPPQLLARALTGAGVLAYHQGDYPAALAHLEEGLALWPAAWDGPGRARALLSIGWVQQLAGLPFERSRVEECLTLAQAAGNAWTIGEALHCLGHGAMIEEGATAAQPLFIRSLTAFRKARDRSYSALVLRDLAVIASDNGNVAAAFAFYDESLRLLREVGHRYRLAYTLNYVGGLAQRRGDAERASACYSESLALGRAVGDARLLAASMLNLGQLALDGRDMEAARAAFAESLPLYRRLDLSRGVGLCLLGLGAVAALAGRAQQAARLFGLASSLDLSNRDPTDRLEYVLNHESWLGAARAALGEADFAAAYHAGTAMDLDAGIAEALATDTGILDRGAEQLRPALPAVAASPASPQPAAALTARELEVLRLIAQGSTNREIAAALVISTKTVTHHSVTIYRKIGARGRAEATAYALRYQLT